METYHYIHSDFLSLADIDLIIKENKKLALSDTATAAIVKGREYLDQKLAANDTTIYGINTGFGSLCNVRIADNEISELQHNLVMSHACGLGDEVPTEVVRLMLLLKIQGLSYGYSGVRLELVQRLIDFYNSDILPVIYQLGSLGASGDLAPLAHLSLPLIGLGEIRIKNGEKQKSADILPKMGFSALGLASKEGLALLNGTQFCAAYAVWSVLKAEKLMQQAIQTAALSIDAFDGLRSPFHALLHQIRPHAGQIMVAKTIDDLLKASEIAETQKTAVQDPYAFRCTPQVLGASYDTLQYAKKVVQTEINAVTDNPTIFPDDDLILSGGNFHAQPLALILDFLAIAMAEIGSISERRTFQLISGQRGLPPFLVKNAGLHSGLMIAQYTAASIVSQNKQLCTPASVDSIVSSNGQEDHVSMASNAATKGYRVIENLERILAIEWLTAAQAIEFRKPLKTATELENLLEKYRQIVPFMENDRIVSDDMLKTVAFFR